VIEEFGAGEEGYCWRFCVRLGAWQ